MPGFDVTPYQLDGAASVVADCEAALRAELNSLAGSVMELLGGSWRGVAASQFGLGWDEWESAARSVVGALKTMSSLLRESGVSYRDAEAASVLGS